MKSPNLNQLSNLNPLSSRWLWPFCGLALFAVLTACGSAPPKDRGAQLYVGMCQSCHQSNGQGAKGLYAHRPASLPRGQYSGAMPQFGFLSDQDAAAVATFVRRSFGNNASEVTPEVVARVRARHTAR